jgi:hypothetical protein
MILTVTTNRHSHPRRVIPTQEESRSAHPGSHDVIASV